MDGRVQVFDVSAPKDSPKYTFLGKLSFNRYFLFALWLFILDLLVGHKSRTFNIAWSPLVPSWLASSSDDCDIRVWSIKTVTTLSKKTSLSTNV